MERLKIIARRVMIVIVSIIIILLVFGCVYIQHPKFGKAPSGERLKRIERSPNFRDGKFHNLHETPTFADGYTFWGEVRKSLFNTYSDREPHQAIPSIQTDLLKLPVNSTVVIWFGHSSCFIQVGGKRILVDPVFSENASPLPGSVKAFKGTTTYSASDLPDIDYVLITHDHYDHLDYETVLALKNKTGKVICGLGVGSHFSRWGYRDDQITERDWYEEVNIDSNFSIYVEPARHKSGRGLKQNNTLWVSFLIKAPDASIYISGDGGYDKHFAEIGEKFGPIDLAIMENGQYDSAWRYVHLLPEETLSAARDLKARKLLPVHHSKFMLARHAWYDPLERIMKDPTPDQMPLLLTPMIGQPINLRNPSQFFTMWWEDVR